MCVAVHLGHAGSKCFQAREERNAGGTLLLKLLHLFSLWGQNLSNGPNLMAEIVGKCSETQGRNWEKKEM